MPRAPTVREVIFVTIWIVAALMSAIAIAGLITYPGPSWIYPVLMGIWTIFIGLLVLHDRYADKAQIQH